MGGCFRLPILSTLFLVPGLSKRPLVVLDRVSGSLLLCHPWPRLRLLHSPLCKRILSVPQHINDVLVSFLSCMNMPTAVRIPARPGPFLLRNRTFLRRTFSSRLGLGRRGSPVLHAGMQSFTSPGQFGLDLLDRTLRFGHPCRLQTTLFHATLGGRYRVTGCPQTAFSFCLP